MPQSTVYKVLALTLMLHCVQGLFNFQIFTDQAYPNKCVVDGASSRVIIDSGKTARHPDRCALVECHRNGWALVYECQRDRPPPNCKWSDYKTPDGPYPACCEMNVSCNDIDY